MNMRRPRALSHGQRHADEQLPPGGTFSFESPNRVGRDSDDQGSPPRLRRFRVATSYALLADDRHGIDVEFQEHVISSDASDALFDLASSLIGEARVQTPDVCIVRGSACSPGYAFALAAFASFYVSRWGFPIRDLVMSDPHADAWDTENFIRRHRLPPIALTELLRRMAVNQLDISEDLIREVASRFEDTDPRRRWP